MKQFRWSDKSAQIIIHTIVWCIVFLLPYLLYSQHNGPQKPMNPDIEKNFWLLNFFGNILGMILFYVNAFVLTPKFIYTKKYTQYIIVLLLIFTLLLFIHYLLFNWLIGNEYFMLLNSIRYNLPTFILALAVSTTWIMSKDRLESEKLSLQTQEENLKTELSFLRSQISPHFVFNVLNNIVALVRLKSEELEPTVMKLSGLMQYMLYETNEDIVLLKTEAEYLQSYIDLQQQRFGKKVKINTSISLNNSWSEIEPMLLIPFVENAFKHGVGMIESPQIDIHLKMKDEKTLLFTVRNKYNNNKEEIRDKTSGIGLANVKRRLNLLYCNKHSLLIDQKDNWFSVSLTIQLHNNDSVYSR